MILARNRLNHLAIGIVGVLAVGAVALKVTNYRDAGRTQGDLRTQTGQRLVRSLVDKGYVLLSEQAVLANDNSPWYRLRFWNCEVNIAPLDPPGATISAFRSTAPDDWTMRFSYRGQLYDTYPGLYVTLRELVSRVLRGVALEARSNDGFPFAVLYSPQCQEADVIP